MRYADRIAYINHDIEDAIRGGVIAEADIPAECVAVLGETSSHRIHTMITSLVARSAALDDIRMADDVQVASDRLRDFMFERVYVGSVAKQEEIKAERLVAVIYDTLADRPELMPEDDRAAIAVDGLHRVVCDYVAGMTDPFAVRFFKEMYLPESWNG